MVDLWIGNHLSDDMSHGCTHVTQAMQEFKVAVCILHGILVGIQYVCGKIMLMINIFFLFFIDTYFINDNMQWYNIR